ncbi:glutaredoxin-C1-like [Carex rostrata]
MDAVTKLTSQRAVVVFSKSSCCMSHTVVRLFINLGVNTTVHELDKDPRGRDIECALAKLLGRSPAIPAVYIGGKLVGSTDSIMSLHMSGNLVPMLHNAGAIWYGALPKVIISPKLVRVYRRQNSP